MSMKTVAPTMPPGRTLLDERVLRALHDAAMRPHLDDPGWLSATALADIVDCPSTAEALTAVERLRADGHRIEHRAGYGAGLLRLAERLPTVTGGYA